LPVYAPDLNPVELLWAHLKSHGINRVYVRDRREFEAAVDIHLKLFMNDREFCKSFLRKKVLGCITVRETEIAA